MGLQPKSAFRRESFGAAIGYNVAGPLALSSFESLWVMERVPRRFRSRTRLRASKNVGSPDASLL